MRSLLLVTASVAFALTLALNWPHYGTIIAPSLFVASLLSSSALFFLRQSDIGRVCHRVSISLMIGICTLYLSLGPACWVMTTVYMPSNKYPVAQTVFNYVYLPLGDSVQWFPKAMQSISISYLSWWMPSHAKFHEWEDGVGWTVPGSTYRFTKWTSE
ncbi:MAG TPA: hypothetical protein DCF63_06945 [Planctomycetaceae bacterium]|nr:hypothetical protein [Planctomycetaceae bacterium]